MKKKTYTIPVSWTVTAEIKVKAANLEEAIKAVEFAPLPSDPDYLDGSFEVNTDVISVLNDEVLTKEERKELCADS